MADPELDGATLRDYLSWKGYTVDTETTRAGTLERAESRPPDVIVIDTQTRNIDGLDLCRRIKATAAICHIPTVAVTSAAMTGDADRTLDAGFDAYLPKPVELKRLTFVIEALCAAAEAAA